MIGIIGYGMVGKAVAHGIYGPCNSVNNADAAPGPATLVFQQTSSAVTATPNVRVCLMKNGLVTSIPGGVMQSLVCDSITGYFLTKKTTVTLSSAVYFVIQVDQSTKYNHDGSLTNYLLLPSGGSWGEAVR